MTERAFFRVVGMYCTSCRPIVENQLKNEDGIKKMDIDFMTDSIVVEFEPTLLTKDGIKEKLERSGYKFVRVAR